MAIGVLLPMPRLVIIDANGLPVPGAIASFFLAGTTTPTTVYADSGLTTPLSPIADAGGRFPAIYLVGGINYKILLTDAVGNTLAGYPIDNIITQPTSLNVDLTGTAGENIAAGAPVYLSDGSGSKTAGRWYNGDSTNGYSSVYPLVGIALVSIASGSSSSANIRIGGYVTGLSGLVAGAPVYISTAGTLTITAPLNRRAIGSADSTTSLVLDPNPTGNYQAWMNDFRITLTSGTPITTTDVTAATTLYCSPLTGNRIDLPDAQGNPMRCVSAEFSIAVPATASQMYDIFCYMGANQTPTLELLAWTNDTTRATAIVRTTNGRYLKSGDNTRLYMASFRTTTVSGQTEDSLLKRYLHNYYNRSIRPLRRFETTASWPYSTGTIRQANGSAANQLDIVVGFPEEALSVYVQSSWSNTTAGAWAWVGIGEDSTTAVSANCLYNLTHANVTNDRVTLMSSMVIIPAIGRHIYVWLEQTSGDLTGTFQGMTTGQAQSGIQGLWKA